MIIGCDYSTTAVDLAQRTPGEEEQWRIVQLPIYKVTKDSLDDVEFMLRQWSKWAEPTEERIIYIEQPWSSYNPMTGMTMTKVATVVQVIALQKGFRVEWAHPMSWRSVVFGKGRYPKKIAKEKAVATARQLTGNIGLTDHNAADAVCIARFGEIKEDERNA